MSHSKKVLRVERTRLRTPSAETQSLWRGPGLAKRKLHLYEVEIDGATYWVAATTSFDALLMVRALDGIECTFDQTIGVDLCPENKAQRMSFHADDGSPDRSILEEFKRHIEPTVIACSEWS